MRRVDELADFDAALDAARKEAKSAFADDAILLEKYITRPRHIEVQLLCDTHGTALHLHERDCSVQRNHQKVIEEAPAPDLPEATRDLLATSALKLAHAINYSSVGTVEYILDSDTGEVFFLEMNTRLQVEHPVTELVTGIDLVEQMIRVAAGEKLSLGQDDITITGWAMEARVAAEDPGRSYLPQTGTITICEEPTGSGIRIDSGIAAGSDVTPWYDSMLAKAIAHGQDREEAGNRLLAALDGWQLAGVGHNLAFLYDIIDHQAFRDGGVDTGFLARVFPDGWTPGLEPDALNKTAAATWCAAQQGISPWQSLGSWRLTGPAVSSITGSSSDGYVHVQAAGENPVEVSVDMNADTSGASLVADNLVRINRGRARNLYFVVLLPEQVLLNRKAVLAHADEPGIRAPMPGLISEIHLQSGDTVQAGDIAIVLEAMKLMQNLAAPVSGTVAAVHCQPGDSVDGETLLIEITPDEAPARE
jgi:3-methylcrotonyl-CoA carboxylase alpha subunit/geranyl-CoA carboxylase alpha subunit